MPTLKVAINDKAGMFYLHPRLDYSNGDQWDSFAPAYSSADVDFVFPGSYLRAGVNTITLEVIEQAAEAVPEAGLNYDAIELDSVPQKAASRSCLGAACAHHLLSAAKRRTAGKRRRIYSPFPDDLRQEAKQS